MLFTVIYCWYDNEVNVVFIGRVFMFSCCLCQILTLPKHNFITLLSSFSEPSFFLLSFLPVLAPGAWHCSLQCSLQSACSSIWDLNTKITKAGFLFLKELVLLLQGHKLNWQVEKSSFEMLNSSCAAADSAQEHATVILINSPFTSVYISCLHFCHFAHVPYLTVFNLLNHDLKA